MTNEERIKFYKTFKIPLLIFESITFLVGGVMIYNFGGWTLLGGIWIILFANNMMMFRRFNEVLLEVDKDEV